VGKRYSRAWIPVAGLSSPPLDRVQPPESSPGSLLSLELGLGE